MLNKIKTYDTVLVRKLFSNGANESMLPNPFKNKIFINKGIVVLILLKGLIVFTQISVKKIL